MQSNQQQAGSDMPRLLQLPDGMLQAHVLPHLSLYSRLQLRKASRASRTEIDSAQDDVLVASPALDINLNKPPFQEPSDGDGNQQAAIYRAVNNDGLQAIGQLLNGIRARRGPNNQNGASLLSSLAITLIGNLQEEPNAFSVLNWQQLPADVITKVKLRQFSFASAWPMPQLVAAVSQACPNLQELSIHASGELGEHWAATMAALPASLHTLDIKTDEHVGEAQAAAASLAAATQLTGLRSLSITHTDDAAGDASVLVPAARHLTHLSFANNWHGVGQVLRECSHSLRSLTIPTPPPEFPPLDELLQHTPELQSLTLASPGRNVFAACSCQDADRLASLSSLKHLTLETSDCLRLLTRRRPATSQLQLQEVRLESRTRVSRLARVLARGNLAPDASLQLYTLELDAAADAQLYARVCGSLTQRPFGVTFPVAGGQETPTTLPAAALVVLPTEAALGPELQQRVADVLRVLPCVGLYVDPTLEQRFFIEIQQAAAGDLQAGTPAAAGLWLLHAMANTSTLVLYQPPELHLCARLGRAVRLGFLPHLRHVILRGMIWTSNERLMQLAHMLHHCPKLTVSSVVPLKPTAVQRAHTAVRQLPRNLAALLLERVQW